jgi:large subunit ribosomal protein L25
MASATLSAEVRYGHGREPQSLSLVARDLDKLLSHIAAGSTVIELTLGKATTKTLIREIQRHPFKKQILHIDFMELVAGEKVIVDIPLVFVGIPEGVRLSGALLEQIVHSIEVNVDPSNIPNHIDVDVTNLAMGHSLHVRDLVLPPGLEVLTDEDTTICAVIAPRAVVEEKAEGEGDAAAAGEPELIRKAKEDEEAAK